MNSVSFKEAFRSFNSISSGVSTPVTERCFNGSMCRECEESGRMFNSSSTIKQALQAPRERRNLSLNRPTTSNCDSVRNLACTSLMNCVSANFTKPTDHCHCVKLFQ